MGLGQEGRLGGLVVALLLDLIPALVRHRAAVEDIGRPGAGIAAAKRDRSRDGREREEAFLAATGAHASTDARSLRNSITYRVSDDTNPRWRAGGAAICSRRAAGSCALEQEGGPRWRTIPTLPSKARDACCELLTG